MEPGHRPSVVVSRSGLDEPTQSESELGELYGEGRSSAADGMLFKGSALVAEIGYTSLH